ncbi:threonine aldolase, partial [Candidatus Bathyarchaeota archaeon]
IVMCDVDGLGVSAEAFVERLGARGVLMNSISSSRVRFVTHRGIESGDIKEALAIIEDEARKIRNESS